MKYCLIDTTGKVIQVQPNAQDGFIECDDDVICGMVATNGVYEVPALTLAQAQAKQKSLIETAYQTAITAPIAYMSTTFQADNASQDILVKVLVGMQVLGATPSGFAWIDANNVAVPMALADLQGLYGAILTRGQIEFAKRLVAKNAINVATTIAEVEAVVL